MKMHTPTTLLLACFGLLYSCQSSTGKAFQTPSGVEGVVNKLNKAFGKGAHYTDITITYVKGIGNTISATGTQQPQDKKLLHKLHANNGWEAVSEVTLEVSGGAQPGDFMFTLDGVDQLKSVPAMVKEAIQKIKKEKDLDVVAELVSVVFPSRVQGPEDPLSFNVNLEPENGGTSFVVIFDRQGKFQRMVY